MFILRKKGERLFGLIPLFFVLSVNCGYMRKSCAMLWQSPHFGYFLCIAGL
jgi:hypothetical protein